MELLQLNPFNTIKANDLEDTEINEQWVDIQGQGFADLFCPTHKISQYLIGGKGSGKTHLMRYFSYKPQIFRHQNNLLEGIKNDGYFGVYFQASGLNSGRFENIPYDDKAKAALFSYSFDLWCAITVIESIITLQNHANEKILDEKKFCDDVISLFDTDSFVDDELNSLLDLKSLMIKLSNGVDLAINNAFFSSNLDTKILATRGSLIFGIPELLSKHSPVFENITFLYLIDELENISESQQVYFNTLIREKKLPCSFRFGARKHGIKTYKTYGSGEENRQGHEFEITILDAVFKDIKNYESFAIDLIIKRLSKAGFLPKEQEYLNIFENDSSNKKNYLVNLFEKPNFEEILKNPKLKDNGLTTSMYAFYSRLKTKMDEEKALEISLNLSCHSDLRVELAAIHLFSQFWSNGESDLKNLIQKSEEITVEINNYITLDSSCSKQKNPINLKFNYYKNNYLAASLRSISQSNFDQYLGFEELLLLTKGFPRHILTVLRNIYKIEVFAGKTPFKSKQKISLKSQKLALKESSEWFHNDCTSEGNLGGHVSEALSRLCEILRIEMYSDKPVECSASGFTVDKDKISAKSKAILEWAELIRVLIEAPSRQEKNSQKLISKYHLNGLLCPKWGLSLSKRGALDFSTSNFNKIFDPDCAEEFQIYKSEFSDFRNAPYNIAPSSTPDTPKLNKDHQIDMGF